MSAGDKTGPRGMGPLTGRAAGFRAAMAFLAMPIPFLVEASAAGASVEERLAEAGAIDTGTMRRDCRFGHARAILPLCPMLPRFMRRRP